MNEFISGTIASASAVAGLYFFRFWWSTRDRFFLYFAASFWIEAANRTALGLLGIAQENEPFVYGVRVVAYGLIVYAVLRKNSAPARDR